MVKKVLKKWFSLATVAGYTRFVLFGRGFLWVMIAGIIMLMIYIASDNGTGDGSRLVFSSIQHVDDMQNIMVNPHYQGVDEHNMPYSIIAKTATQKDADTVLLDTIKADMATRDGKWLALEAGAGELKIKDKKLTLTKNVDMFYDGGYEFRSASAFIDMAHGSASGNQPVEGQGPMGTLNANGFEVRDQGGVIIFNGSVRVIVYRN